MKIDENTGLPELPEGYFWRVRDGINTGEEICPGVEVAVMKNTTKLRRFKRVPAVQEVTYSYVFRSKMTPGKVDKCIQWLAEELYRQIRNRLPVHDALNEEIASYAGDYPPKKLGE